MTVRDLLAMCLIEGFQKAAQTDDEWEACYRHLRLLPESSWQTKRGNRDHLNTVMHAAAQTPDLLNDSSGINGYDDHQ